MSHTKKRTKRQPRPQTNQRLANQIKLIEKKLIETKYIDELNAFTSVLNTGQAFCLNNFAQGDTVTTRNGNKIFMDRLMLKYTVTNNQLLIGPVNIRVIIVHDTSPSGQAVNLGVAGSSTFLGPTGVLDNTTIVNNPHLMPEAFEMKYRYKLIYDKVHTLNPYGGDIYSITGNTSATATMTATNVIDRSYFHSCYIPLKKQAVYQDGTANVSSLLKGSLVALCLSDQTANSPTVAMATRLYFRDA